MHSPKNLHTRPKKAATAILIAKQRNTSKKPQKPSHVSQLPGDFRVLMVKRSARTSFMKDLYVFPGGSVDESDFPSYHKQLSCMKHAPTFEGNSDDLLYISPERQKIPQMNNTIPDHNHPLSLSYAFRSCALREIFEETSLISVPHHTHTFPATPIDLDNFLQTTVNENGQNNLTPRNFTMLSTLSTQLGVPIHEVMRRIIHLNDQTIIKTLYQSILPSTTLQSNKEVSLFDICTALGLEGTMGRDGNSILDTLIPIARWVAPINEKKRFDTIFYATLIDSDDLNSFKCLSNESSENSDNIDEIMSYFKNLSVLPAKNPTTTQYTLESDENTCAVKDKLSQSTLGQEIADICLLSPHHILNNAINGVTLAPPTQYILSQLCSMTYDEMNVFLNESNQNVVQMSSDPIINPHIAYQPLRSGAVSFDPFTYKKILSMSTQPQNPVSEQTVKRDEKDVVPTYRPHFDSIEHSFQDIALKTKGYVVLPQDYEHPLTEQLLLQLFNIYEGKVDLKPLKSLKNGELTPFQEYTLYGQRVDDKHIQSITNPADIISIICESMSPRIPLSNVDHYITPLQFYQQQTAHSEQKPTVSMINTQNPIVSRYNNATEDVKALMGPLIHYHRIVDNFETNWTIVASNKNIIKYTKDVLSKMNFDHATTYNQQFAKM